MLAKDDMAQPAPADKVKFDAKQAIYGQGVTCEFTKIQGREVERIKFFEQPVKKEITAEACNKKCLDDMQCNAFALSFKKKVGWACHLLRTDKCRKEYKKIPKNADYAVEWYKTSKKRVQPFQLLTNANCIGDPAMPLGLKTPAKAYNYWNSNPKKDGKYTLASCDKQCSDDLKCQQFSINDKGVCGMFLTGNCIFSEKKKTNFYTPSKYNQINKPKLLQAASMCTFDHRKEFQIMDQACQPLEKFELIKKQSFCNNKELSFGKDGDKNDVKTVEDCDKLCKDEPGCVWFDYNTSSKKCNRRKAGCENSTKKATTYSMASYRPTGYRPYLCQIESKGKKIDRVESIQGCNNLCVKTKGCKQFGYGKGEILGACEMYKSDLCTFENKTMSDDGSKPEELAVSFDYYRPTNWFPTIELWMIIVAAAVLALIVMICCCVICKMRKKKDHNTLPETAGGDDEAAKKVHEDMKPK